jgi:hypothetical protein
MKASTKKIMAMVASVSLALATLMAQADNHIIQENDQVIQDIDYALEKKDSQQKTKIGVFMAADNDLFPFARRNLKQLQNIGSNKNVKIYVHFDLHPAGQPKMSKRLIIEKNKILQVGPDRSMDSGNPKTLIDFCKWFMKDDEPETATKKHNHVLVLWNHGTGAIEPTIKHAFNPSNLWSENESNHLIELNRDVGFLDFLRKSEWSFNRNRGICFDDTTGNYLTNIQLKKALHTITHDFLDGRKIDIVAFDACLMSMIEVAYSLNDYAHIAVGSEEVELGTGYDYYKVLKPFLTNRLDPLHFAKHMVNAYKHTYSKITNDYTQSAIDLRCINDLKKNINNVALILIDGLKNQQGNSIKEYIKSSKHKNFCTHFDEPSYIDIDHLYVNLLNNIKKCRLQSSKDTESFKKSLTHALKEGRRTISKTIRANTVGSNLKNAKGISIYFPERHIHNSYYQSDFAADTHWLNFVMCYLSH